MRRKQDPYSTNSQAVLDGALDYSLKLYDRAQVSLSLNTIRVQTVLVGVNESYTIIHGQCPMYVNILQGKIIPLIHYYYAIR